MGLDMISTYVPDLQSNPEMFAYLRQFASMSFGSICIFLLVGIVFHDDYTVVGRDIRHCPHHVLERLDYLRPGLRRGRRLQYRHNHHPHPCLYERKCGRETHGHGPPALQPAWHNLVPGRVCALCRVQRLAHRDNRPGQSRRPVQLCQRPREIRSRASTTTCSTTRFPPATMCCTR